MIFGVYIEITLNFFIVSLSILGHPNLLIPLNTNSKMIGINVRGNLESKILWPWKEPDTYISIGRQFTGLVQE